MSMNKKFKFVLWKLLWESFKKNDFITFGSDWVSESDKNIVKLCVHFVSVCLKVQKWRQTETKVTFHPPENFFLSQMKGMAKIRLFYSGAMALILPQWKNITLFVFFMFVYKGRVKKNKKKIMENSILEGEGGGQWGSFSISNFFYFFPSKWS